MEVTVYFSAGQIEPYFVPEEMQNISSRLSEAGVFECSMSVPRCDSCVSARPVSAVRISSLLVAQP